LPAHPSYADLYQLYRTVILKEKGLQRPAVHENDVLEQFAVVPVKRSERLAAVIVIGPATQQKWNDEWYAGLLDEYAIPCRERPEWIAYWRGLPVINRLRFLHVCVTAHWMLNQEALDVTISIIGARLTFYDQSHFVKVFKKHAGVTPKQYRNRAK
jgi:AraC-like DNA-binding protein